jgi:16S rRNA (guanine(966)-N(2))-methyltransferase RsmD
LRIIAGKFRGRKLKSPPTEQTRPTSDRLRETLFNVLAPRLADARFLDLCAGTGAVGLEALSRGAAHVTFVDRSRKMSGVIESNLETLQIDDADYDLVNAETFEYLRRRTKQRGDPFDIIFFDPPYATDYDVVLKFIGAHSSQLLSAGAAVIVEHHKKKLLADQFNGLIRYRELKQGDSVLSFYQVS